MTPGAAAGTIARHLSNPEAALRSVPLAVLLAFLFGLSAVGVRAGTAATCGILVSTTGTDTPTCGLDAGSECRTIKYGMGRATALGRSCVFVRAGTYNEILVPRPGVDVTGGFDASWNQGTYDMPGFETRVIGGYDPTSFLSLAVNAVNTSGPSTFTDLVLQSPDATGVVSLNGQSSCVVFANRSTLTLQHCLLQPGNGAPGLAGMSGSDAASLVRPPTAGTGGNGAEYAVSCDNLSRGAGGSGATNACTSSPSSRTMDGGSGGAGGPMDTDCFPLAPNYDARPGMVGANAAYRSGTSGQGGAAGPANSATPGRPGGNGFVANGAAGAGGTGGSLASGRWVASGGWPGSTGENGGGGGGGGGAGGDDTGTDAYGAGGGGGGAGGCAALAGGYGGGGGGGSFGVVAILGGNVTMNDCAIVRGTGGAGGAGGTGGNGQPGGFGGPPGAHPGAASAGAGGNGAHGGHGGGGGGGAGGQSYAGVRDNYSVISLVATTVTGGSGGAGGAGGISAPAAAPEDDDGNDGLPGSAGGVGLVLLGVGAEPARATVPAASERAHAACSFACFLDAPSPGASVPLAFAPVAPNPVVNDAVLRFGLPEAGRVRLELFDAAGRRLRTLADAAFPAGEHAVRWDGAAVPGGPPAGGVYLLRMTALGRTFTRTAIVVR